jgi:hypothetical protein
MNSIYIEPSRHSPLIDFKVNGKLFIEGRSVPEDVNRLFVPLIEFASQLDAEDVVFDINLEYFNTATSKRMLELLKNLDLNNAIKNLTINWHYEADDDDNFEMGHIYEECLTRATFAYKEHLESFSLAKQREINRV